MSDPERCVLRLSFLRRGARAHGPVGQDDRNRRGFRLRTAGDGGRGGGAGLGLRARPEPAHLVCDLDRAVGRRLPTYPALLRGVAVKGLFQAGEGVQAALNMAWPGGQRLSEGSVAPVEVAGKLGHDAMRWNLAVLSELMSFC